MSANYLGLWLELLFTFPMVVFIYPVALGMPCRARIWSGPGRLRTCGMRKDTIVAISTPVGVGALGIIRLSGPRAVDIVDGVFSKDISEASGYSVHFGRIMQEEVVLDEVLATVFRGPRSFTREDACEVSFHGSPYILREALSLFLSHGARLAEPGEFTQRAFLNGALDLAQAEAVADLIASTSARAHRMAVEQLRGGVSDEIKKLRGELLDFTSLLELELDFSEEDVEFADRGALLALVRKIKALATGLAETFRLGNAIKEGVPTVIMGRPNAGKSTLLNALLQENRAIVSAVAGTTRDVIEDRLVIEGIEFRLQDTAGIRATADEIEAEGVRRSEGLARKAAVVLYVFDPEEESEAAARDYVAGLDLDAGVRVVFAANKADLRGNVALGADVVRLSALVGDGLSALRARMVAEVQAFGEGGTGDVLISNVRHVEALRQAAGSLEDAESGLQMGLTQELVALDIRHAVHFLGEITGEITTDEVLGNIFGKFCIGK